MQKFQYLFNSLLYNQVNISRVDEVLTKIKNSNLGKFKLEEYSILEHSSGCIMVEVFLPNMNYFTGIENMFVKAGLRKKG